jgi:hypothetical protein
MRKTKPSLTLEEGLLLVLDQSHHQSISLQTLFDLLGGQGYPFFLVLISLPFCQPIQIPGLSTPFGLVIFFIGLRMAFSHRIWLPKMILKKNFPLI